MANLITGLRIIISIIMLIYGKTNYIFWILYGVCGLTDVLDGYIARVTKTESEFGGKLDSIADLFFGLVIIKILYSIVILNKLLLIWIIVIALIKIISIIIVLKKYNKFAIIHTYLNKITGLLIYLGTIFITFSNYIIYVICIIATITALEELCINIKLKKLEINKKSIFGK